jgi:hypothetical protein
MVDFTNLNLCGASPELNSVLEKLDAAKAEIAASMDSLASEASAAFGAAQNELNSLIDKLQTIEIPTLPKLNLQAEIASLTSLVPSSPSFIQALAKIKAEFGDSLDAAGLELDSLVKDASAAITGGGSVCSLVPNFEKAAGGPVVEKPVAVKQAADKALIEALSVVKQNEILSAKIKAIGEKTAEYVVTNKVPTEDTGAFKIVPDSDVKTISTASGSLVKSVPAGTGNNVSPDAGFQHKKSTITEKVKFEDIMDEGGGRIIILTKYIPVEVLLIQLHPSANYDNLITSTAEEKAAFAAAGGTASWRGSPRYVNSDGPHMEYVLHYSLRKRGIPNVIVTIDDTTGGISLTPPFENVDDHPGNIESVPYERWNGKTWVQKPGSFRGGVYGGRRSDKVRNKRYGGFAAVVKYTYLDNYDADIWSA